MGIWLKLLDEKIIVPKGLQNENKLLNENRNITYKYIKSGFCYILAVIFHYNCELIKTVIEFSEWNPFLIIIENKNYLLLANPFYIIFYNVLDLTKIHHQIIYKTCCKYWFTISLMLH